jgi:hypothetical protein
MCGPCVKNASCTFYRQEYHEKKSKITNYDLTNSKTKVKERYSGKERCFEAKVGGGRGYQSRELKLGSNRT